MKNAPVLDREHLLEMTDGDAVFEHELLSTYRASAAATLARLEAALSANDLEQIIHEAHALKGSSLNVGAAAMGQCAGALEAAARDRDPALVEQLARLLDREAAALWAELDRL